MNALQFWRGARKISKTEIEQIQLYLAEHGKTVELKFLKDLYEGLLILRDKGCWVIKDWSRYGVSHGKRAHRVSYELFFESIPLNKLACHTCDRPGCRNPFHIFIGSHGDNFGDAVKKGLVSRGGRKRKLSQEELDYIQGIHWRSLRRFASEK